MRVRIIFNLKNRGGFVPFHHQYLIAQWIRGVVIFGGNEKLRDFDFYNFSALKGQTKVSRKGLHYFSSKITLVFSCLNKEFLDYFLKEVFKYPEIELGNLTIVPDCVEVEKEMKFEESTKFICISPLVVKPTAFGNSEGKEFIIPGSDEFSDLLYESTIDRMEKIGLYTAEDLSGFFKFQIVPDKQYLQKLTDSRKKYARIYPLYDQDIRYEVRGYTFPFKLYASPEVQKFVFNSGLGFYTHKGFGMLDVAFTDPNVRTTKYEFEK